MIPLSLGNVRADLLEQIAICKAKATIIKRLPGKLQLCGPMRLGDLSDLPHCPDEMQLQRISVADSDTQIPLHGDCFRPTPAIPVRPDPGGLSGSRLSVGPLLGVTLLDQVLRRVVLAPCCFPRSTYTFNNDNHLCSAVVTTNVFLVGEVFAVNEKVMQRREERL
ncbi:hypothetical protein [Pararhizobium sp.]|uniref:hypothetical protein n=1 Tax=Pararhizobium sp. TaxID=1977563 RepID=UPI003D136A14